jgi:hypothetical protein
MTSLIACLGSEKPTIAHVAEVIKRENWEKVYLIAEAKTEDIQKKDNIEFIIVNKDNILSELSKEIEQKLRNKINDLEVALNIISGSGKLHMATLSAVLKLGLGIRLIALTKEGIKEI